MKTIAVAAALSLTLLHPARAQQSLDISRSGSRTSNAGPVENFTGEVRVEMAFAAKAPGRTSGGYVTFSPGARSAWHTHPIVQVLVVTEGVGRVQEWGGPVNEMHKGDVIRIPAGVKHWHGAAPNSSMTHLAVTEQLDGKAVDWLEKVSDAQYAVAPAGDVAVAKAPNTVAQKMFGDVAPKLAQLTDQVLFDDVWARPGLSQRDRSLVTVSALIALNRMEQLRSHMARARTNGLSEDELVETLTHLAFYAGWPNAINAATVARDVFKQKP
jgi:4-carboxymuconolactone decarboxylase